MSQKTNPLIFRLGIFEDWRSQWFASRYFRFFLEEDRAVRDFLKENLKEADIEKIEIKRVGTRLMNIIIWTARPGLIIGRKGAQIREIEEKIKKILAGVREKYRQFPKLNLPPNIADIKIDIQEVKEPEISAQIIAQEVARELEKRTPYRRVLKSVIGRVSKNSQVKGIKIRISGRLEGADMARSEWLSWGTIPLQTLRADIDYGFAEALPPYGKLGIKVWIYKQEKFKSENQIKK